MYPADVQSADVMLPGAMCQWHMFSTDRSGTKTKAGNHDVLAQKWFYGLMTRPNMEQNIRWMFALLRPKRSVDIKVERKLHDMRI